jgi:hypothetical protein
MRSNAGKQQAERVRRVEGPIVKMVKDVTRNSQGGTKMLKLKAKVPAGHLCCLHFIMLQSMLSSYLCTLSCTSHDSKNPESHVIPLLDKIENSVEESQKPTPAIPSMPPEPSIVKLLVDGI